MILYLYNKLFINLCNVSRYKISRCGQTHASIYEGNGVV